MTDCVSFNSSGEDCDDKNVLDGDGCSIECRIEENFNCKGQLTEMAVAR